MRNIYLITCTRTKSSTKTKAEELYKSKSFQKARKIAEKHGDLWFILSAKHGLLSPEKQIEPYDKPLTSLSNLQLNKWSSDAFNTLKSHINQGDEITIIGDDLYAKILTPLLREAGYHTRVPLLDRAPSMRSHWLNAYSKENKHYKDLDRFYKLLNKLKDGVDGMRRFEECHGGLGWPKRGVYFIFEDNEKRFIETSVERVVRVGTHGVSAGSKSSLWNRLQTHRGIVGNGGNHRSSVFRLHVGAAIIEKSNSEFNIPTWGKGQTATNEIRDAENFLENEVTDHIGNMKILWLSINDASSAKSDRSFIEKNSIALLSGKNGPLDLPSKNWLGNYSKKNAIKKSSLWNINYVYDNYDRRFLDIFEEYVDITLGNKPQPEGSIVPRDWLKIRKSAKDSNQIKLI